LKHANSILEYFEYFCQILTKLLHIISSYTISNMGRFLRHSVVRLLSGSESYTAVPQNSSTHMHTGNGNIVDGWTDRH